MFINNFYTVSHHRTATDSIGRKSSKGNRKDRLQFLSGPRMRRKIILKLWGIPSVENDNSPVRQRESTECARNPREESKLLRSQFTEIHVAYGREEYEIEEMG